MKEILFIRNNIEKWRATEMAVENAANESPDHLSSVYMDLTADLAFAQTHYPDSRITLYLNNLSSALHNEIYRNKKEKWSRLFTFWTKEVPDVMWKERRLLLISFMIFAVGIAVGVLSTLGDESFPRLIMGDFYVDMTLENIKDGNPMGVYGSGDSASMFWQITVNNIMVSFNAFALGLLTSFAPGLLLFRNGVMIGSFDTFFYQQGLLGDALWATMLHGTLELSSIVVAGAAGLAMGNGWLFPGTYSRLESFKRGAKRGLKIVVGTVPLFIIAGFIESFVTRHTDMDNALKLLIIGSSALFIAYYFIILPYLRNHKSNGKTKDTTV